MDLELFDYTLSAECYKARLLLDFLGLKYRKQVVNYYPNRDHKRPGFTQTTPFSDIPVLKDGDATLWTVGSILHHLAATYDASGAWLPKSAPDQAKVLDWVFFAASRMQSLSLARLHDLFGMEVDIGLMREQGEAALRILDDVLTVRHHEGHIWLASSTHPTIADVACFPDAALAGDGGLSHDEYPALRKWLRAFRSLPRFDALSGIPEFV